MGGKGAPAVEQFYWTEEKQFPSSGQDEGDCLHGWPRSVQSNGPPWPWLCVAQLGEDRGCVQL